MFITTYGIVRRLGGEIAVDSTEGKGATVSVTAAAYAAGTSLWRLEMALRATVGR